MKNQINLLLSLLLICNTFVLLAQISPGEYTFTTKLVNRNLDIMYANRANGTGLHIWDINNGEAQKFKVENSNENGYYLIKSQWGKCLDVSGSDPSKLHMWDCNGGNNQKWKFKSTGDGYYNIQSKLGTYIDVRYAKKDNGSEVGMSNYSTWEGNGAQRWKVQGSGGIRTSSTTILTHGLYKIKNVNSGKFIAIPGGNPNEIKVIQWSDVGQLDVIWNYTLNEYGNGFCNVLTGNVLSCPNDKVNHLDWQRNGDDSVFDVLSVGNAYMILNKKTKKIVGVENSEINNGAILKLFDYSLSPSKNCLWYFEPFTFDDIEVVVKTGGDDLRGGNDAFLEIDGIKYSLNKKAGWNNNTSNSVRINCKIKANSVLKLVHDGSPRSGQPFDSYDNWNQDYILIRAFTKSGQIKTLYESSDKTRFTGEKRTQNLGLFLCSTVVPG